MNFKVAQGTDVGIKRSQNEDSIASYSTLGLFIVADGMGGHRGGAVASSMVTEIVPGIIERAQEEPNWDPKATMNLALTTANKLIFEKSSKDRQFHGMGTTATAMLFKETTIVIGHVGDSRCYFLRPHTIWQLTRDHSWVQERLRAGLITRDEMKGDRTKNIITRSVGYEKSVDVDVYQKKIQVGDVYLLCSDGLFGLIRDLEILSLVQKRWFEESTPESAIHDLIQASNKNGGDDNISVIIVEVTD